MERIKANELRINNLVEQGRYGILPCRAIEIARFESFQKGNKEAEYYSEWKPIQLTEEWLLKFGFFMENKSYFILLRMYGITRCNYNLEYTKDLNGDWYILINESVKVYLEHVHQLQNLYFALTGEELTIQDNEQTI